MKTILATAFFIASILVVSAEKANFENYRFYSVHVENEIQLKALRELSEISDSYSFMDPPSSIGSSVDIVVPPHQFAHWSELVKKFSLTMTLNSNNFQELLNLSEPKRQSKADGEMDWENYFSTAEIHAWMIRLQQTFPQYLTLEDIGYSYEGRPLKLIKLSKQPGNRAVFVEGLIHAREWISGATITYILNELLFSTDPAVQDLAQNIDWYILPVTNPDGYEYTRDVTRMWRKTRSQTSPTCWGVDPNRNFAYNWMTPDEDGNLGASSNPCSDTYSGNSPFSEPETTAVHNYVNRHREQFDLYLAMHSYAHMFLHPLGTTRVRIPNFDIVQQVGNTAARYLEAVHGVQYRVGSSIEILSTASGTSRDHAWGYFGIPLSYTVEMRGNGPYGNYGFALPPHLIKANCEEVLAAYIGMVSEARNFGYLQR